jgi:short-subunit dehydrogenase
LLADLIDSSHTQVGANLGQDGYLETIAAATEKIDVQLVFNNAGFIVTGFFHKTALPKLKANLWCNAVSAVDITHLFVERMLAKELKGCVVFTSSAAAYMPGAFASMYASTKAFISTFAASIAAEVKSKGIDVMAFHPSPVASRFYDDVKSKIDLMEFFKKFSVPAEQLPDEVFKAIGYSTWRDIGGVAIFFRMFGKLVDYNLMMVIFTQIAHTFPDYKRNDV